MTLHHASGALRARSLRITFASIVASLLLTGTSATLARGKNLPLIEAEEAQCVREWLPRHQRATRGSQENSAEWAARWCLQWRARVEHARGMAVVAGSEQVDVNALACANQTRLNELVQLGLRWARPHGALVMQPARTAR